MKTKRACSLAKRSASGGERTTLNVTSFMLFLFFFLFRLSFSSTGKNPRGREKKWREILERCDFVHGSGNSFKIESEDIQFGADLSSIPFLIIFRSYWFLFLAMLGNQQKKQSTRRALPALAPSFCSVIPSWWVGAHVPFLASAKPKINELDA